MERDPQEAVDIINAAVIVDESLKVTVGAEEKVRDCQQARRP